MINACGGEYNTAGSKFVGFSGFRFEISEYPLKGFSWNFVCVVLLCYFMANLQFSVGQLLIFIVILMCYSVSVCHLNLILKFCPLYKIYVSKFVCKLQFTSNMRLWKCYKNY